MTNIYCPNCYRQLHELDIKIRVCTMCNTPLDVKNIIDKYKAESEKENEN